jgi:hypothetical protein
VVQVLLRKGAEISINAVDSLGQTALIKATSTGNASIAELLIKHKANVNSRSDHDGMTPLLWAAQQGPAFMVRCPPREVAKYPPSGRTVDYSWRRGECAQLQRPDTADMRCIVGSQRVYAARIEIGNHAVAVAVPRVANVIYVISGLILQKSKKCHISGIWSRHSRC